MNKSVLMFQVGAEKQKVLKKLALSQHITLREVPASCYTHTIGSLAGGAVGSGKPASGREAGQKKGFPMEMIVFCQFSSTDLDHFLDGYKKSGAAPIPLKAVMTPYNRDWTPEQLFRELFLEHLKMAKLG